MKIYLTIDDGPSERADELIAFLSANAFGAVLFCRGDNLLKRPEPILEAIRNGFMIGNHSYSHPHFDKLSEGEAREEIEKTDAIIDNIYAKAGEKRRARWFRFPYGNAGANEEAMKANRSVLKRLGYNNPFDKSRLDWFWDVYVEDWHVDENNVEEKLRTAGKHLNGLKENAIIDMHDQTENVRLGLFQKTCNLIKAKGFGFYENKALKALALSGR